MHDLTRRLIERLHEQTLAGRLEWAEGSGRNSFSFEADGYHVTVEATASTAAITIADGDGRELETLDEEALASATSPSGKDYETLVRDIHQNARRAALGTDEAISRILKAIDED
jgi:2-C-methyl-D-erythritol 4-phosphate cytidylyltransferase